MEASQGKKPEGGAVTAPAERANATTAVATQQPDQASVFAMFDKLDDKAIADEIEGRIVEKCVYHFAPKGGGPEVWGLGKKGVDLAVTEMAKKGAVVRDEDVSYAIDPTDPEYVLFKARCRKVAVNTRGGEAELDAAIGLKRQWTRMVRKEGGASVDPFWFEKGGQKAIRNARLRLIPEDITATIIAYAKKQGRVQDVSPQEVDDIDRETRKRGAAGTSQAPAAGQGHGVASKPVTEKQVGFFDQLYRGLIKRGYDKEILEEDIALHLQKEMGVDIAGRRIPGQLNTKEASKAIDFLKGLLAQEEGQGGGPGGEEPGDPYGS